MTLRSPRAPALAALAAALAVPAAAPDAHAAPAHRHETRAHLLSRRSWGAGDRATERLNQAQLDTLGAGTSVPFAAPPAYAGPIPVSAAGRPVVDFVPPFGTVPRPGRW